MSEELASETTIAEVTDLPKLESAHRDIPQRASIVRQALANGIGWVALAALNFLTTTTIYRLLGAEQFGIWSTIFALRGAILFLDAGLALGVTRDAALGSAESLARIQAANRLYRLLGLGILFIGTTLFWVPSTLLRLDSEQSLAASLTVLLLSVEAALALAASPLAATIRGLQRFDVLARGSLAQAAVGVSTLISMTALLGLPGAGAALILARLVPSIGYLVWLARRSRSLVTTAGSRASDRAVFHFALPLWVTGLASAFALSLDVPIVAVAFGSTTAGAFAVGAALPTFAVGALWMFIDTVFPRLVEAAHRSLLHLARLLVAGGSLLAGAGFMLLILHGDLLLRLWLGESPELSVQVLTIYSIAWALNIPTHVLGLVAIARATHGVLVKVVIGESIANLAISLALLPVLGPVAPAVGTLVTLGISNVVIVPLVLRSRIGLGVIDWAVPAAAGYSVGLALSGAASVLARLLDADGLASLVISVVVLALVLGGLLLALALRPRTVQRVPALVFDGGLWVTARQRRESDKLGRSLRVARIEAPIQWRQHEIPLVTVRIATYNRGATVAERAIASATAQTHDRLEILVVGDHCDEATEAAVRGVRDPRVRFHNLPQRGRYPDDSSRRWMVAGTAPMNWALEHARGDWIAPLDDDDEFTPDHVEALLHACRRESAELAYGVALAQSASGTWKRVGSWPPSEGEIIHAAVLYNARLRGFTHAVDAWRVDEPADWNLWKRMKWAGVRMTFLNQVVVRHYAENRDVVAEAAAQARAGTSTAISPV